MLVCCAVRRRAAAKKKKLKNLGKSKSTDTEEEEGEDDQDDGELYFANSIHLLSTFFSFTSFTFKLTTSFLFRVFERIGYEIETKFK